jgi:hypothetical protein
MKEAGLTVGGSYKHFKSRDDLVAESVGSAPGFWKRQVETAASGGRPVTYEPLVDDYLNEAHRNDQARAVRWAWRRSRRILLRKSLPRHHTANALPP